MSSAVMMGLSFVVFFLVVFAAFFVWNRVSVMASSGEWKMSFIASVVACALFMVCFAIGVWFSIARMKGDGWILSA